MSSRAASFVAASVLLIAGATPVAGELDLELSVDVRPQTVREGESVLVTITAEGSDASGAEIEGGASAGELLIPAGGFSRSQQVSWINGRMSAKTSFQVEYLATRSGEATLPAFTVVVDGDRMSTEPVSVRVLPRAAGPAGEADDRGVSVEARLSRKTLYIGESLVLEYILRSRVRITGYAPERLPQLADFLVEDDEIDPQTTARQGRDARGRPYNEFVLFRRKLAPTKAGQLTIPPVVFTFSVQSSEGRRRSFFFEPRIERVARYVDEETITVRPLPAEGRPDDFIGAVGSFSLEARLASDRAVSGEAVNLVATLRGDGHLGALEPPRLAIPADIQAYDPLEEDAGEGARRWVFPLVPRAPGRVTIDGVHLSAFDPEAGRYETLAAGPFVLDVDPARGGGLGANAGGAPVRVQATDLRFIHPHPSRLVDRREESLTNPLLWILGLAPLAGLPALLLVWEGITRYSSSAAGRRARTARRTAALLAQAERRAPDQADDAALDVLRAIHLGAGEMLGQPSRPLERSQLRRRLAESIGNRERAEAIVELIDVAEGLRYGGRGDAQAVERLIENARELLGGRTR